MDGCSKRKGCAFILFDRMKISWLKHCLINILRQPCTSDWCAPLLSALFSFTMLLLRLNPNISRCFYFGFSLLDDVQVKQLTDSVQKNKGTRAKTPTPSAMQWSIGLETVLTVFQTAMDAPRSSLCICMSACMSICLCKHVCMDHPPVC